MKRKLLVCLLLLCTILSMTAMLALGTGAKDAAVVAEVSMGKDNVLLEATSLADAVALAAQKDGCTLKLVADTETDELDVSGTYTFDLNGYTLNVSEPLVLKGGFLTVTDSAVDGGGKIEADDTSAILMKGGNLLLRGGTVATQSGAYALEHKSAGVLFLAGQPKIDGTVYVRYPMGVCGNDGTKIPQVYKGDKITIYCDWYVTEGSLAVRGGSIEHFELTNQGFFAAREHNGHLITTKMVFLGWAVSALLLIAAVLVLVFTIRHSEKVEKKIQKLRSVALPFTIPAFLPFMAYMNEIEKLILLAAGALFIMSIIYAITSAILASAKLKKATATPEGTAPAAEAPVEEASVEATPVEETPVEEAPVEEAPVEETPAEETPVEETPVEETPVEEAPVEEAPVEEAPVEEASVEEAPVEETPVEEAPAEEPVKEYAPLEANVPVVCNETGKTLAYSTYRRSFLARIIASPEEVQGRYDELKNALLSYKKVTARTSWSYESIKSGRKQLAKFAICGKTLCLFLAIDPATLGDSKYNVANMSSSKKYETVPCRLRLTSKRSVKWGLELIAKMAENEQLVANPKYKPTTYVPVNEPDEVLLEKGLIKKVQ